MGLTEQDRSRYTRQMMLGGWGEAGQEKLKAARVFVAGAGGLGSPASMYLAVAGVGHLTIADFDSPDLSNLNRQILHNDFRVGLNKALSAQLTPARAQPQHRSDRPGRAHRRRQRGRLGGGRRYYC